MRAAWAVVVLLGAALALWTVPNAFRGLGGTRKPGDILIWGMSIGPDDRGLLAVFKEFERRHPGTRLRVLSMGAGHMNPQKLLTSIVGGVAPDIVLQGRFNIADWASRGAFRPLDDLLARDAGQPDCPKRSEYYPRIWEEASWDGKVYGIPTMSDDRALYWNRRVFRESAAELRQAGLDPERPPRTWTEMLAYSRVLTKFGPDGQLKRAGFLPNYGNAWPVLYGLQKGARLISPDGRRVHLDTPEMREALKFMGAGYDVVGGIEKARRLQQTFLSQENDPFFTGQVVMKVDGDWTLPGISRYAPQLDFGVASPPMPDDRVDDRTSIQSWVGGWSYVMPAGAVNQEGAWEFIKFATSLEARTIEAEAQSAWEHARGRLYISKLHAMPSMNEALFTRYGKNLSPLFVQGWRTHIDLMPRADTRPVTIIGQALWDEHVRAFEKYATHELNLASSLHASEERAQRELDEYFHADRYPIVPAGVLAAIAGTVCVGLAVLLLWSGSGARMKGLRRQENRWAYLFISPWIIGLLVLTLGPLIVSLALSLTQWDVIGPVRWAGLANYRELLGVDAANTEKAFTNILFLCLIGVPLGVCTSLSLSLLLNASTRGIGAFRTLFYLPSIVPVVASTVLWAWILNPDPARGLVNRVWAATLQNWLHVAPPGWFAMAEWSKPGLIVMGLWGAGGGIILWLAGLKSIPRDLYEAAELDGANPSQSFYRVTLPMLSPILFFSLVVGFIGAFQEFDRIYVLVPPDQRYGVGDSLLVPMVYLFEHGFARFRMGYASAIAWLIFLVLAVVTWLQFRFGENHVYYEARK